MHTFDQPYKYMYTSLVPPRAPGYQATCTHVMFMYAGVGESVEEICLMIASISSTDGAQVCAIILCCDVTHQLTQS